MNKSEFIQQASIQLMSANCLADMMCFLKGETGGSADVDLVKDAVKKAEKLWEKLEEKGYCSELDVVASSDCAEDDCYINGNCDTP